MNIYGSYFYGNKISEYGLEHNRVDYGTLAKAFDAVLNNEIMGKTIDFYWEKESGNVDNSEEIDNLETRLDEIETRIDELNDALTGVDCGNDESFEIAALEKEREQIRDEITELEDAQYYEPDVYQWYIVSDAGARILEEINEIVYYCEELDMYLWGVTHYGTSWDYVLTDIPCNTQEI